MEVVKHKFRWVESPIDRSMLALVVCGLLAINIATLVLSIERLVDARESPATAATIQSRSTAYPIDLVVCATNPLNPISPAGFICAEGATWNFLIQEGGTPPSSQVTNVTVVPCRVTPVGGLFSCVQVDVPPILATPIDISKPVVYGYEFAFRSAACALNATLCGNAGDLFIQAVRKGTPVDYSTTTPLSIQAERYAVAALPTLGMSFAKIRYRTKVDLKGNRIVTPIVSMDPFRTGPSYFAEMAAFMAGGFDASVTVSLFSFDLDEEVVTQVATYSVLDVLSTLAAISSLTMGFFFFCFPTTPTIPLTARWSTFGRSRNIDRIILSNIDAPTPKHDDDTSLSAL